MKSCSYTWAWQSCRGLTALWPRHRTRRWTASARLQPAVVLAANINLSALDRDPCIRAPWAWATRRPATPPPTPRSPQCSRCSCGSSRIHSLYHLRFYVFTKNRIQVLMVLFYMSVMYTFKRPTNPALGYDSSPSLSSSPGQSYSGRSADGRPLVFRLRDPSFPSQHRSQLDLRDNSMPPQSVLQSHSKEVYAPQHVTPVRRKTIFQMVKDRLRSILSLIYLHFYFHHISITLLLCLHEWGNINMLYFFVLMQLRGQSCFDLLSFCSHSFFIPAFISVSCHMTILVVMICLDPALEAYFIRGRNQLMPNLPSVIIKIMFGRLFFNFNFLF